MADRRARPDRGHDLAERAGAVRAPGRPAQAGWISAGQTVSVARRGARRPDGRHARRFQGDGTRPGRCGPGAGGRCFIRTRVAPKGSASRSCAPTSLDLGGGDYRDVMAGVDRLVTQGSPTLAHGVRWMELRRVHDRLGRRSHRRFKAARMGAGMSDLVSMYGTSEISGYIGLFEGGTPNHGHVRRVSRAVPTDLRGSRHDAIADLAGASDPRVPPGQSMEFYRALGIGEARPSWCCIRASSTARRSIPSRRPHATRFGLDHRYTLGSTRRYSELWVLGLTVAAGARREPDRGVWTGLRTDR